MVSSNKLLGFTLLELIIVLIIVGSYAIFNSPEHKKYLTRTKRSDAKQALVTIWYKQELYKKTCGRYANVLNADAINSEKTCIRGNLNPNDYTLAASPVSSHGYYKLSIVFASDTRFLLQAVPIAEKAQANDTNCAKFTLDHTGNKLSYNHLNQLTTECWQSKKS
jgi:type IV pilus assembly protein PilE